MKIHSAWLQIYEIAAEALPELQPLASELFQAHKKHIKNDILDYIYFHDGVIQLQKLSGRDDFGWYVGSRIPAYGMIPSLRSYFASLPNVAESGAEALRLQAIAIPGGFTLSVCPVDNLMEYQLVPVDPDLESLTTIADLIFAIVDAAHKVMVDDDYEYERVFQNQVKYDQKVLRKYSTAELVTNSDKIAVQIKQSWLSTPLRYASSELVQMLKPVVEKELAKILPKKELVTLIEEHLRSCDKPQQFKLKDFAKDIGKSEISIRRKLTEQDLNFSDLVQNYVRTECMSYLVDPGESIDSIAYRLGFSERAALERAFKRWYGVTPSKFREQFRTVGVMLDSEESLHKIDLRPSANNLSAILSKIDQEASYNDIALELKKDLPLAAKIISTANSAFYGAGKVHEMEDAIGRVLGLDALKRLVQVYSFQNSYQGEMDKAFNLKRLLFISFFSELLCRNFLSIIKLPDDTSAMDFVNVGQFGLLSQMLLATGTLKYGKEWVALSNQVDELSDLLDWERENIGTDSYTISNVLLSHWGMASTTCRILVEIANCNREPKKCSPVAKSLSVIHQLAWRYYQKDQLDEADFIELADSLGASASALYEQFKKAEEQASSLHEMVANITQY